MLYRLLSDAGQGCDSNHSLSAFTRLLQFVNGDKDRLQNIIAIVSYFNVQFYFYLFAYII